METVRKLKISENAESRCHSARNCHREGEEGRETEVTSRTRSASPSAVTSGFPRGLPLKKFHNLCSKIVFQLDVVKNLSKAKTNDAENLVDLRRQLQRADEFAIRFSRNNLYDTKRILNEIKNLARSHGTSSGDTRPLSKKIILGYQAASQSLQIYINYIKNPANVEVPDKITELVLLIAELFLYCEYLYLSPEEMHLQNDAVKTCNELLSILKSKPLIGEYLDLKREGLMNAKSKKPAETEEPPKKKNLSMYMAKCGGKGKAEMGPKRIPAGTRLLGVKGNKTKKKDEKKARITQEIYLKKMNPQWHSKSTGNKIVKFEITGKGKEAVAENHGENQGKKKVLRRSKFFTPREVRSQDDDVETMVQTIDEDELPTLRIQETPVESDLDEAEASANRKSFRELLLEAIENLGNSDKNEQKAALKKLLDSIRDRCNRSDAIEPCRPPAVKVYHFKHEDNEENDDELDEENETDSIRGENNNDSEDEGKSKESQAVGESRLKSFFKEAVNRRDRSKEEPEMTCKGLVRKIRLDIGDDELDSLMAYKKSFQDYTKNNVMYRKKNAMRPWDLVAKVADRIILDLIKEIAADFESDAILKHLYRSELFEAIDL